MKKSSPHSAHSLVVPTGEKTTQNEDSVRFICPSSNNQKHALRFVLVLKGRDQVKLARDFVRWPDSRIPQYPFVSLIAGRRERDNDDGLSVSQTCNAQRFLRLTSDKTK